MKISTKNEKKMRCHKKIIKNEKIKKNEEWTVCPWLAVDSRGNRS